MWKFFFWQRWEWKLPLPKNAARKILTTTFGVKEVVLSCGGKKMLQTCVLAAELSSFFSVKCINKFRARFVDKCFKSVIISLVCRSVWNDCSFPRAAFPLKNCDKNSLLLHISFTFCGVQYTVKTGSLIRWLKNKDVIAISKKKLKICVL